jgi:hypothetical protein
MVATHETCYLVIDRTASHSTTPASWQVAGYPAGSFNMLFAFVPLRELFDWIGLAGMTVAHGIYATMVKAHSTQTADEGTHHLKRWVSRSLS